MIDPVVHDDWHPVLAAASLGGDAPQPASLLGNDLALWRDGSGQVHAWEDRCPHRGTRLSVASIVDGELACRYHGWRFGVDGACTQMPAEPGGCPSLQVSARAYRAQEHCGLIWVCLGLPESGPPPYPEYADPRLRSVVCGPYDLETSGPRIVENFLDMAHFPYVHEGFLGDLQHTQVRPYEVAEFDDECGSGIVATQCYAWQPRPNATADQGGEVEYRYRVLRPLTAILTKQPQAQAGDHEAISLHIQPLTEERSRVWIVLALPNFDSPEQELRAFQDEIFAQDLDVLHAQLPRRLPLAPRAEVSIACDRLSLAYRRYLRHHNLRYGVLWE